MRCAAWSARSVSTWACPTRDTELAGAGRSTILQQGPARSPSLREVSGGRRGPGPGRGRHQHRAAAGPGPAPAAFRSSRRPTSPRNCSIPAMERCRHPRGRPGRKGGPVSSPRRGRRWMTLPPRTYRAAPDDLARLGFAVAPRSIQTAPAVTDLDGRRGSRWPEKSPGSCRRPSGRWSSPAPAVAAGAHPGGRQRGLGAVCRRPAGQLSLTVPECNSLGLGLLGARRPRSRLRGRCGRVGPIRWSSWKTISIRGADAPVRRRPCWTPPNTWSSSTTSTTRPADGPTWCCRRRPLPRRPARWSTTRAGPSASYQVFVPAADVQASWRWLRDLMTAAGRSGGGRLADPGRRGRRHRPRRYPRLDELIASRRRPRVSGITGQQDPAAEPIATAAGRPCMADIERPRTQPPEDPDSPLAFSMEGYDRPAATPP